MRFVEGDYDVLEFPDSNEISQEIQKKAKAKSYPFYAIYKIILHEL